MPSVGVGWVPLGHPSAFRWIRAASGSMEFGLICVRGAVLNRGSSGLGPIRGYWNVEMGLRVVFITATLEMTGFRINRFCQKYSVVWTPQCPPLASLPFRWSLDPAPRIYSGGKTQMET